jgi:hypothetical protein
VGLILGDLLKAFLPGYNSRLEAPIPDQLRDSVPNQDDDDDDDDDNKKNSNFFLLELNFL